MKKLVIKVTSFIDALTVIACGCVLVKYAYTGEYALAVAFGLLVYYIWKDAFSEDSCEKCDNKETPCCEISIEVGKENTAKAEK